MEIITYYRSSSKFAYYVKSVGCICDEDGWYDFGISMQQLINSQDKVFHSAVRNLKFLIR